MGMALLPLAVCLQDTPVQTNGVDCGVFAGLFAEHHCRRVDPVFATDVTAMREQMVLEILTGQLQPRQYEI